MKINIQKSTDFYLEGHEYDYPAYHYEFGDLRISCIPLDINGKIYYLASQIDEEKKIRISELAEMNDLKPYQTAYSAAFKVIEFYLDCVVDSFFIQEM